MTKSSKVFKKFLRELDGEYTLLLGYTKSDADGESLLIPVFCTSDTKLFGANFPQALTFATREAGEEGRPHIMFFGKEGRLAGRCVVIGELMQYETLNSPTGITFEKIVAKYWAHHDISATV